MKTVECERKEFEVLRRGVSLALDRFYENDADLMALGVGEVCLVGNFYRYFHAAIGTNFRDSALRIDMEYDRTGEDGALKRCLPGRIARPDLLVHHRGDPTRNLCVIEFKRSDRKRGREWVDRKLRAFTCRAGHGYRYGCFIEFGVDRASCKVVWYGAHDRGQRALLRQEGV